MDCFNCGGSGKVSVCLSSNPKHDVVLLNGKTKRLSWYYCPHCQNFFIDGYGVRDIAFPDQADLQPELRAYYQDWLIRKEKTRRYIMRY